MTTAAAPPALSEAGPPQPFAGTTTTGNNNSETTLSAQVRIEHLQNEKTGAPPRTKLRRFLDVVNWKPKRTRWNPDKPPVFNMAMNVLFGFAGAFTVADLYYSHPILNVLARDFGVSQEQVSRIPTLSQAGYAVGLLFLCPLGDIFKRRPFVLALVFFTATLWIGLCTTKSFNAFCAISFLTGITTVTPQLMLPLVGDLAPPNKRAAALSIVSAGNLLGILIARLLSGIVANFTSWRNIYWIALALQYAIFSLLWLFMPDYPSTNLGGMNYFKLMWTMLGMLKKHPVLVQACLIAFCTSAPFTNYWTTLTFLLSGAPYFYSPLVIGLFALIGIAGMVITPLYARRIIDGFVPLFSVILGELIALVGVLIGTYSGLYSVAGPCIQAFALDMGLQTTSIANRSSIYAVEPKARNRVNTVFMVATFLGQITGTAAGNTIYAEGGWVASGSFSVGLFVMSLIFCAVRGPWTTQWVGWQGGWSIRKKDPNSSDGHTVEKAIHERTAEPEPAQEMVNESGNGRKGTTEKAMEEEAGEDGENVVREMNERKGEKDLEAQVKGS